jgi:hypothetical protein
VATGRHTALDGIGLGNVHDGVEEVGLAMLATEVLASSRYCVSKFEEARTRCSVTRQENAHSADDIIVVGKVRLALLAAENLVGGQIDVVRKTHGGWFEVVLLVLSR